MLAVIKLAGKDVASVSVFDNDEVALEHAMDLAVSLSNGTLYLEILRSLKLNGSFSEDEWSVQIVAVQNRKGEQ